MKSNPDWYSKGGSRHIPMTEEELIEKKALPKKDRNGWIYFRALMWERKCSNCGKEGVLFLEPEERPSNDIIVKVKKSKQHKVTREKKHGKNMTSYKDEKMGKGAQPW